MTTTTTDSPPPPPAAAAAANLDSLKSQHDELAAKVRELKESSSSSNAAADSSAIQTAVQELLQAKKAYAEANNGIGVDGKPYNNEGSEKKDKKKKKKGVDKPVSTKKRGRGRDVAIHPASHFRRRSFVHCVPTTQLADPNSASSQKKAAKKAAAKAKKAAMKAGGADVDNGATNEEKTTASTSVGGDAVSKKPPSPPSTDSAKKSPVPAAAAAAVSVKQSLPPTRPSSTSIKVQPNQIVINPNVAELSERPVVALTVAILTNSLADYQLVSDHTSRQTCLGLLPSENDGGGGGVVVILGDYAMARYMIRRQATTTTTTAAAAAAASHHRYDELLGGPNVSQQAVVDAYVDYAMSLSKLYENKRQRIQAVGMTLEYALADRTYLVGDCITLADLALFGALGFPSQYDDLQTVLQSIPEYTNACRFVRMMAQLPAILEATQCALGVVQNVEAQFTCTATAAPAMEPLEPGMNALEGGVVGRVVTRFPPEPSGYLHIGHAKAVLLNDYYARRYQGRLIVRFDDTNPSKEKEEFQEAIVEDLRKLDVTADVITYTSDYFDTIRRYAEDMIQNGLAFMDDTPQEQMKAERLAKTNSKHRDQSPADAFKYFKLMCSGDEEGAKWCLRAKIDMQSLNGTMRDPVIYRQNLTPHHRSGTQFKAYPTYDLACPIVDSLEGVTHALRTTEYNDRDEQYHWFQRTLGLRRTRIHSFARVNFVNTVLSKRKLTWFVENGYVTGWDDPRFPTVRGVVNLGLNIAALRKFMYAQGASRRVVHMEWSKFWAENKKEIDKTAKRYMAIDKEQHTVLTISNAPDVSSNTLLLTDLHPKDPSLGQRVIRIASRILLENVDANEIEAGENIVLVRWGEYFAVVAYGFE
jgi:glutamyl-tRNA synthetase